MNVSKDNLENRISQGVVWSGSTTLLGQVLTFLLGIVLARLLSPQDFGTFAAVVLFTEIGSSIVSSGFVAALIQTPSVRQIHYSTAWVTQLAAGGILCLGFVAASPLIGILVDNVLAGQVLAFLALNFLILPFVAVPTAILQKTINFRDVGLAALTQQTVMGFISILCAFLGWGVWSLVAGKLIGNAVSAVHLSVAAKWAPRPQYCWASLREVLPFAKKMTAGNIANDLANNVDYLLIGRLLGAADLGFYYRAYHTMMLPVTKVASVISQVLFPAFASMQDRKEVVREILLKSTAYTSLICMPIFAWLFWDAPILIPLIYGEQWLGTVTPLQIMCFAGPFFAIEAIASAAITALGYVGVEVKRQLTYVGVIFVGILVGSYWGLAGVAIAVLAGSLILWILIFAVVRRLMTVGFGDYFRILLPSITGSLVMCAVLGAHRFAALHYFHASRPVILASSVVIGAIVYLLCFFTMGGYPKCAVNQAIYFELQSYGRQLIRRVHRTSRLGWMSER